MKDGLFSPVNPSETAVDLQPFKHRKGMIIGAGQVGMACAYSIMIQRLFSELVLVDMNKEKLEGEVMDLAHGEVFAGPTHVRAGEIADGAGSHIVVVTAGAAQRPGETRLDLVQRNVGIFKSLIPQIVEACPDAIILIVSNPVDVLTYAAQKISGLPPSRVIGSGCVLDTGRFRQVLGREFGLDPRSVHAYILGEHGDSEFAFWSGATIAGTPLVNGGWEGSPFEDDPRLEEIVNEVRTAAYEIIQRKGYTSWAVGLAVTEIVSAILSNQNRVLTVSTLLDGELGVSDVCLSLPAVVNRQGAERFITTRLSDLEQERLEHSANTLKEIISGITW